MMATFTEKSHMDIFSSENLIYLSSQSKEVINRSRFFFLFCFCFPVFLFFFLFFFFNEGFFKDQKTSITF